MVDLMDSLNHKQFHHAMTICVKAKAKGWLNDREEDFVTDLFEQYEANGKLLEPTVKQVNWLKQIAREHEDHL